MIIDWKGWQKMNGFRCGASVCLVFVVIVILTAGCYTDDSMSACTGKQIKLPLVDYTKLSAYGKLPSIEEAGYFRIGRRYVHAPKVEFVPVKDACCYDLLLLQEGKILGVTKAEDSGVFAENGWQHIKPAKKAAVVIIAYNKEFQRIALSRLIPFHVAPDFSKEASASKKRSYKEAALMAFKGLCDTNKDWTIDGPGSDIRFKAVFSAYGGSGWSAPYSFPVLHDFTYIDMLVSMNKIADEDLRQEIIEFARSVGDHLLMCRVMNEGYEYKGLILSCADSKGEPYLGIASTGTPEEQEKMARRVDLSKCGYAGEALVNIYKLTGDTKYFDAAIEIAEVLSATQLENGSWNARVDAKTGEVIGGDYSTSVIAVVAFMDALNEIHPDKKWITARDKGIEWLENNPFKTYAWVVNFDDGPANGTSANPFGGTLSNTDLFKAVQFIAVRPELFSDAASIIRDQLRWCDNHFVFYGDDPLFSFDLFYPVVAEQGNPTSDHVSYAGCWVPMDGHTLNYGRACLAAYKFTKDKTYLDKAIAAANALTQYQLDDGRTLTWMPDKAYGLYCHRAVGNMGPNHTFWVPGVTGSLWSELVVMGLDN